MNKELDIRVAEIIETGKIVINKGSKDFIDIGMEFLVYEDGGEIRDPVTGDSLGNLENPKGTFKAFHIQDTMTVLLSETKRPSKLFSLGAFGDIDPKIDLLKRIKVGDKVKIIN